MTFFDHTLATWIGASIISCIGILQKNQGIVIGSMAISPIANIFLNNVLYKGNTLKWIHFIGYILLGLSTGVILHMVHAYFIERDPTTKHSLNLLLYNRHTLTRILVGQLIISFIGGVLTHWYPRNNILLTGVAIALTLGPGISLTGIYLSEYINNKSKKTLNSVLRAATIPLVNFIGLGLGHFVAKRYI
jgi:hypothetical protein